MTEDYGMLKRSNPILSQNYTHNIGTYGICDITPFGEYVGNGEMLVQGTVRVRQNNIFVRVEEAYVDKFSEQVLAKAEEFLRTTVGDDNFALLENGDAIFIHTSNKRVYCMNRLGRIGKGKASKIFAPKISEQGQLHSDSLPMDDVVASFYVWANNAPDDLEAKWGCGNITIKDKTQ